MTTKKKPTARPNTKFHLEFADASQKLAFSAYEQHDCLFLVGPAGVGKTHLAMAFAISDVLQGKKKKIILTRPIVEAGESLGFLPGDLKEKVDPYMRPLYDVMSKMVGGNEAQKEIIQNSMEVAPLAFMRGRTLENAVCILDEAQNCDKSQLKLFFTRLGDNSKMIVTGDPTQSDIGEDSALVYAINRLNNEKGISVIEFGPESIQRHELVGRIIAKLNW